MNPSAMLPLKTGYRGRTFSVQHTPIVCTTEPKIKFSAKRGIIGGKGREWGSEMYKLLERMRDRVESYLYMQPVDPVQHSEFYSMVNEPLDLSKILLNFHSGIYHSLANISNDVTTMLTQLLKLFKDSQSQEHQDLINVQAWFREEIETLREKCGSGKKIQDRPTFHKSLSDRIDAIEQHNRSVVGAPFILHPTNTLSSSNSSSTKIFYTPKTSPSHPSIIRTPTSSSSHHLMSSSTPSSLSSTVLLSRSQKVLVRYGNPSLSSDNLKHAKNPKKSNLINNIKVNNDNGNKNVISINNGNPKIKINRLSSNEQQQESVVVSSSYSSSSLSSSSTLLPQYKNNSNTNIAQQQDFVFLKRQINKLPVINPQNNNHLNHSYYLNNNTYTNSNKTFTNSNKTFTNNKNANTNHNNNLTRIYSKPTNRKLTKSLQKCNSFNPPSNYTIDESSIQPFVLLFHPFTLFHGGNQFTTNHPIVVTEEGFDIPWMDNGIDNISSKQLHIGPKDLLRCCLSMHGNQHIIFLYLMPHCYTRVSPLSSPNPPLNNHLPNNQSSSDNTSTKNGKQNNPSSITIHPSTSLASTATPPDHLVILTHSLNKQQSALLLSFFYSFQRNSIFPTSLFSELNHKNLKLLLKSLRIHIAFAQSDYIDDTNTSYNNYKNKSKINGSKNNNINDKSGKNNHNKTNKNNGIVDKRDGRNVSKRKTFRGDQDAVKADNVATNHASSLCTVSSLVAKKKNKKNNHEKNNEGNNNNNNNNINNNNNNKENYNSTEYLENNNMENMDMENETKTIKHEKDDELLTDKQVKIEPPDEDFIEFHEIIPYDSDNKYEDAVVANGIYSVDDNVDNTHGKEEDEEKVEEEEEEYENQNGDNYGVDKLNGDLDKNTDNGIYDDFFYQNVYDQFDDDEEEDDGVVEDDDDDYEYGRKRRKKNKGKKNIKKTRKIKNKIEKNKNGGSDSNNKNKNNNKINNTSNNNSDFNDDTDHNSNNKEDSSYNIKGNIESNKDIRDLEEELDKSSDDNLKIIEDNNADDDMKSGDDSDSDRTNTVDFEEEDIQDDDDEDEDEVDDDDEIDEEKMDLLLTYEEIATRCPITQAPMRLPVRNQVCGHVYDRHGAEQLVQLRGEKARCPVYGCHNNQALKLSHLLPTKHH